MYALQLHVLHNPFTSNHFNLIYLVNFTSFVAREKANACTIDILAVCIVHFHGNVKPISPSWSFQNNPTYWHYQQQRSNHETKYHLYTIPWNNIKKTDMDIATWIRRQYREHNWNNINRLKYSLIFHEKIRKKMATNYMRFWTLFRSAQISVSIATCRQHLI